MCEGFPGVVINDKGVCGPCGNLEQQVVDPMLTPKPALPELRRIIDEKNGGRKRKYDCVIGASGGLDSSYVLLTAKKKLGLNPLVIHYDTGLNYEHAFSNLKRLCEKLDVEFRVISSRGNWDRKYVREVINALKRVDAYWGVCTFCHHVLVDAVNRAAVNEKIPVILTSRNIYEEKLHLSANFRLKHMVLAFFKRGIPVLPAMLIHLTRAGYFFLRLKMEFSLPPVTNLFRRRPKYKGVSYVNVTEYVPWEIGRMIKELREEVGWKVPEHPSLQMRFDCKIEDSFINHTYRQATGLTIHGIIASNLIACGVMKKEELTDAVKYYDDIIKERKEEVLKILGRL